MLDKKESHMIRSTRLGVANTGGRAMTYGAASQQLGLLSCGLLAGAIVAYAPLPVSAEEDIGPLPDATVIINGPEPEPAAEVLGEIPGLTQPQRNVAQGLDELCNTTQSSILQSRCAALRSLGNDEARRALQEIVPSQLPSEGTHTLFLADAQVSMIANRLQSLRHSSFGKEVDQFLVSFNDYGLTVSGGGAGAGESLAGRVGLFLTGLINTGDKDTTDRELGFDFDSQGITAGVDYRFTDTTIVGGALGYTTVDAEFHSAGGDQDIEALTLSAYGTHYATDVMYVDWIASYSDNDYETTRNLSAFNTETQGDSSGNYWALSLSAGAELSRGAMVFSPYARLEYMDAEIDSYTEEGGAGFAINYDDQSLESFTSALGARIARAVSTSWAVLSPSAYVEWVHEFQDDARLIHWRLAEDPSVGFTVETDDPDRDFFKFGLAAAATFAHGRSAYLSYESYLDMDDVSYHQLDIGLRVAF